jgi:starch phosphorylase
VGDDNIFLFGLKTPEVNALTASGYRPMDYYHAIPELRAVIDFLAGGINGMRFDEIVNSLLHHDPYLCLADFADYIRAQRDVAAVYGDKTRFTNMSLVNISRAGYFSADRSVAEYGKNIWHNL